jgi:ABC-type Fe3+ transport system permease subunit
MFHFIVAATAIALVVCLALASVFYMTEGNFNGSDSGREPVRYASQKQQSEMFHLIVAVTAIALVVCIALASIFYGGQAFTEAKNRAEAKARENGTVSESIGAAESPNTPKTKTIIDTLRLNWGTSDGF